MNLKLLGLVAQARRVCPFTDAGSELFKVDTLPHRVLKSTSSLLRGVDYLADMYVSTLRKQWTYHRFIEPLRNGIERYGSKVAVIGEPSSPVHVWQIGEHVVLWDDSMHNDRAFRTLSPLAEIASALLRCALAEHGTDTRLAFSHSGFLTDSEPAPEVLTSSIVRLADQLRVELTRRHRTVLLHGPAGAGKTAASRQLAEALGRTTIVVGAEMFDFHAGVDIFALLKMWQPDCVVLDDIDRAMDYGNEKHLLSGITRLRATVPLVIATANTKGEFSGAVLRPGRFDRVLHMATLDESIVRARLASLPIEIQDRAIASGLIGSYLDELALRYECGGDPAIDLAEMLARQGSAGDGYEQVKRASNKTTT